MGGGLRIMTPFLPLQGTTEVETIFRLCAGLTGEVQTRTVVTIHGLVAAAIKLMDAASKPVGPP